MSAPPRKAGLSLYADLLDGDKKAAAGPTISGAPVKYDVTKEHGDAEAQQKKKDASLKFQPIKRPQVPQKAKAKAPSSSSAHKFSSSTTTAAAPATASSPDRKSALSSTPQAQQQPNLLKSNIDDWIGDGDDDYYFQGQKTERGGRKSRKKKSKPQERTWDWDDIYDPTMPNNYADYKGSDEQNREIRDWKARLYYHQLKAAKKSEKTSAAYSDEEEESRPRPMNSMFAPPSSLNFAPPSFDENAGPPQRVEDDDIDNYAPPRIASDEDQAYEPPPPFAHPVAPVDPNEEDPYMRRVRISGMAQAQPMQPLVEQPASFERPPPPPSFKTPDVDVEARRAEAQAKIAAFKAKLQKPKADAAPEISSPAPGLQQRPTPPTTVAQAPAPPPPPAEDPDATTISRAPVRYELPPPPPGMPSEEDVPMTDVDQLKSNKPGQKGFAERLLKKYGWEKGQGLGAQGEGITTAIVAKAEKRKKLPDAEGGKWAAPANMGKIVGGKKRKVESEGDTGERFGNMSEVVKLEGMLNGLDVQKEVEENNLMQEVGDEMDSKYGNVERVFIWREAMGGKNEVFVKFTSQLSALRAVNATDGMTFAENEVMARFWDGEKFDQGVYE